MVPHVASKGVHMIGNPKYNYGDIVQFHLTRNNGDPILCTGTIEIIDKYGTFEQNKEVSYDIMVRNFADSGELMFVKHILESELTLVSTSDASELDPNCIFNSTKKY